MRCKYCGGEINLSVGRCIGCARPVDDTSDIRILHDLGSLTEKYGLDPNAEKYDSQDNHRQGSVIDQRTEAETLHRDLKKAAKPGIRLQTYYELLGDEDAGETAAPDPEPSGNEAPDAENDSAADDSPEGGEGDTGKGILSEIRQKVAGLLDRADRLTQPVTERLRLWVESRMPRLNRARSSSKWERLALAGAGLTAVVLVIVVISAIAASIPESIRGEWIVSDEGDKSVFTVEFSRKEVVARVYGDDGEAYIYRKGTYTTQRQNGRDLLTIEYEDGSLAHLYYELDGREGSFVNVDTGTSDRYILMD